MPISGFSNFFWSSSDDGVKVSQVGNAFVTLAAHNEASSSSSGSSDVTESAADNGAMTPGSPKRG